MTEHKPMGIRIVRRPRADIYMDDRPCHSDEELPSEYGVGGKVPVWDGRQARQDGPGGAAPWWVTLVWMLVVATSVALVLWLTARLVGR
jgi:acyl dehydratase